MHTPKWMGDALEACCTRSSLSPVTDCSDRGSKGSIARPVFNVPAFSYERRRVEEAASGARAHGARVSLGVCARRRAGSWSTWRPRPGKRWAVARRTPCMSSRCAHARLRQMCGRAAGETHERSPSGGACGGSAAQCGHQGGLAGCFRQVRRAQSSGATAVDIHGAPAWRLQPWCTMLTLAVCRVRAPHCTKFSLFLRSTFHYLSPSTVDRGAARD